MAKIVRESLESSDRNIEKKLKNKFWDVEFDDEFVNLVESHTESHKCMSPPELVEEDYGLQGISRNYEMPYDLDECTLENLWIIFMHNKRIVEKVFNDVIKINKGLKDIVNELNITINKEGRGVSDIIVGATSKMNLDDIHFFIDKEPFMDTIKNKKGKRTKVMTINGKPSEYYTNLLYEVESEGIDLQWFPSPETLNKILKQID